MSGLVQGRTYDALASISRDSMHRERLRLMVDRLFAFVTRLDIATERGVERNDIRLGLRIIAFERSAIIALLVREHSATVVRIFSRGQDWEGALRRQFASA